MNRLLYSFLILFYTITYISCTQHKFGVHNEVHDSEHIKQHLENKIDINELNEEQQKFHYFSMHDLNKDNRIDGIEILKALAHDHEHGTSGPGVSVTDEEAMIKMIDIVLADSDYNGDGFIDYSEYIKKQNVQDTPK